MPRKDNTYNDFLPLYDGLVEFASMLLKSRDDAEDAVQDLFLKLWKRKDTISEIENPEAYCRTVLRNICLDSLKSAEQKNKGNMPEELAESESVEYKAIVREQLANVRKVIDRLPAGQKTVIIKKVVEDRSYREISEQTGMSNQLMRTQLSLARRSLRSRFAWGFASVAVLLAILLSIPRQPEDTFSDPAQAYAQLEKAFETISSKVDKGTAIARSAGTKLEKAEDIMDKVNLKK